MPAGIGNAYVFQVFNSASFSLIIGLPVILYLKSLGASASILGVAMALPPLLNILQIPAARYVERIGYKTFVLRGWTLRSVFILGVALITLLPSQLDDMTRVCLVLFMLFLYNTSRGISVCGFLPWISQLVPEHVRGRFISIDQVCGLAAISATAALAGLYLQRHPDGSGFFAVFFFSFLAAMASIYFLRRIPDVEIPESLRKQSSEPIPWRRMLAHRPFKHLLVFNAVLFCAQSGSGVLIVPLLRDHHGVSDSLFLYLNASWGAVFIIVALVAGRLADRVGSKPLMTLGMILMIVHFAGWAMVAGGAMPLTPASYALQQITWGASFALYQIANLRLLMQVVPPMGRSHFFAIFSVAVSLAAGITPVFWGAAADMLVHWSIAGDNWHWHAFSLLYLLVVLCGVAALVMLRQVEEPSAMSAEDLMRELLIKTPARALSRLFYRRPVP